MANNSRDTPSSRVDGWPDVSAPDAEVEVARRLVANLLAAMDGRSIRSVADLAGLDEKTVRNVIAGKSWPDLRTIALLEQGLGCRLYPHYPNE